MTRTILTARTTCKASERALSIGSESAPVSTRTACQPSSGNVTSKGTWTIWPGSIRGMGIDGCAAWSTKTRSSSASIGWSCQLAIVAASFPGTPATICGWSICKDVIALLAAFGRPTSTSTTFRLRCCPAHPTNGASGLGPALSEAIQSTRWKSLNTYTAALTCPVC